MKRSSLPDIWGEVFATSTPMAPHSDTATPPAEEDAEGVAKAAERTALDASVSVPLVGLCGLAQSGKDTFAGYLGYRRIAFADALKELALAANPHFFYKLEKYRGVSMKASLQAIVEQRGWEYAKAQVPGVRQFLQDLGVGVRDILGPDTWVNAAFRDYDPAVPTVFTDVRFENEFAEIRRRGGVIVRVIRLGQESGDAHVSENGWQSIQPDWIVAAAEGDLDVLRGHAEWLRGRL